MVASRGTRRLSECETLARYGSLNLAGNLGLLPSLIEVSRLAAATISKAKAATLTRPGSARLAALVRWDSGYESPPSPPTGGNGGLGGCGVVKSSFPLLPPQ